MQGAIKAINDKHLKIGAGGKAVRNVLRNPTEPIEGKELQTRKKFSVN